MKLILLSALLTLPALAKFGVNGFVKTYPGKPPHLNFLHATALQKDQKIVSAGGHKYRGMVTRHNTDGSLDKTFGNNGVVFLPQVKGHGDLDDVVVREDGVIIVTGEIGRHKPAIFALTPRGKLLKSFGKGGVVQDFVNATFSLYDYKLAVDRHNRVFLMADCSSKCGFAFRRYDKLGRVDPLFKNGAKTILHSGTTVQINQQGKIYVSGYYKYKPAVVRYTDSGALDYRFGNQGRLVVDLSFAHSANGIIELPQNQYLVYGEFRDNAVDYGFVAKVDAKGNLVKDFASKGFFTTKKDYWPIDLVLQESKNSFVAKTRGGGFLRFFYNGKLDQNFGSSGMIDCPFGDSPSTTCHIEDMELQKDGKIVLAAYSWDYVGGQSVGHLHHARYKKDGSLDK